MAHLWFPQSLVQYLTNGYVDCRNKVVAAGMDDVLSVLISVIERLVEQDEVVVGECTGVK